MKLLGPTFAEIDLAALEHNIKAIKKIIPSSVKFMAVVKADAYGHGAIEVSRRAVASGVDYLSVATLKEALELRAEGISFPILILSESLDSVVKEVVNHDLTQTVYSFELAQALSVAACALKKKVKVHFKVDTGMGRIGIMNEAEAVELLKKISRLENLEIEGIFTHFAKAADDPGFTADQIAKFKKIIVLLEKQGIHIPIKHAANSAAALSCLDASFNMVRIGLSMYGLFPSGNLKKTCSPKLNSFIDNSYLGENECRRINLKPVLSFKTKVMYIKRVSPKVPLSYGGTFVTEKESVIATLPVGYADGYSRALSNRGQVLIAGKRFNVIGNVCMDMTLVDVTGDGIKVGDEVVLIGSQGAETISADDVAEKIGTINYEVICGIGKRVPRVYI